MDENQDNLINLIDTTDCLEAVGVFRGWKTVLFLISLGNADTARIERSTPLVLNPEPAIKATYLSESIFNSRRSSLRISIALGGARRSFDIPGGNR